MARPTAARGGFHPDRAHAGLDSIPGTVSQVRACTARLVGHAKATGAAVVLVGHVTKEGTLGGPRTLEHMVDVVLQLEGQEDRPYRVLRCTKNRFGAVNEAALFQMNGSGMVPVDNPSSLFLQERVAGAPGTVVYAGMEGTRLLLIEIQALVGDTSTAYARRTVVRLDPNRVALLEAVIEKHLALPLAGLDAYVNVVGGMRLAEPTVDAAAVAAMLSSIRRRPLDPHTVVFGEVGLAGEVRGVPFAAERLAEAAQLGFTRAVIPPGRSPPPQRAAASMQASRCSASCPAGWRPARWPRCKPWPASCSIDTHPPGIQLEPIFCSGCARSQSSRMLTPSAVCQCRGPLTFPLYPRSFSPIPASLLIEYFLFDHRRRFSDATILASKPGILLPLWSCKYSVWPSFTVSGSSLESIRRSAFSAFLRSRPLPGLAVLSLALFDCPFPSIPKIRRSVSFSALSSYGIA